MTKLGEKIRDLLLAGFDITYGRVTISNMNNYTSRGGYQVHSDDARCRYSALYNESESEGAVDKFCWIIGEIKRIKNERTTGKVKTV